MATPHEFYLKVIGKGFDEGYGYQCVTGFKEFCKSELGVNFYGKPICYGGKYGNYAYRIWDNFDSLGLGQWFDKVSANQMVDGDWAIWDYGSKPCPYSHIAMFRKDNGNGTGIFLGQNQVPNNAKFTQVNISYSGLRGALRPKIYHQPIRHKIGYRSHLAGKGWQGWKYDGETSGTTGESRRLEAIQIDYWGEVYAKAHIEGLGWKDFGKITKDTVIGTEGRSLRLECLCLKGNFKYRVHLANYGWTCWTDADGIATLGSVGQALQIEAIQIIEL
jgi:hypothetical protein